MANNPNRPAYDLAALQAAAARKDGFYITPRARQDAENLGYDPDDVREIICSLTQADFCHVWILKTDKGVVKTGEDGKAIMMDVYRPEIKAPNGDVCKIYLKLKFSDGKITATSAQSFHQDR